MQPHEFLIIASGAHPDEDRFEDCFFEAGCDDATIAFQDGVIRVAFTREAESFADAVASAVRDVLRTGVTIEGIGRN